MQATRRSVHRVVRNCRRAIERVRLAPNPREADLFERCRRATLAVDHHRARYERVADERDALRRRVGELEQQVSELEGEVTRLTDEVTASHRTSLEVSGPARHLS